MASHKLKPQNELTGTTLGDYASPVRQGVKIAPMSGESGTPKKKHGYPKWTTDHTLKGTPGQRVGYGKV